LFSYFCFFEGKNDADIRNPPFGDPNNVNVERTMNVAIIEEISYTWRMNTHLALRNHQVLSRRLSGLSIKVEYSPGGGSCG
jgi:hypothetical protein